MKHETILSLDNIALDLPIAGIGSRALAAALDYFLLGVLNFIVFMFVIAIGAGLDGTSATWFFAIYGLVVFFVHWGYFAISEMAMGGQTLGKRWVHLRVVGPTGGQAGVVALLVRNLLRPLDLMLGIPLIAFDPLARRLGDRLAATRVVHEPRGGGEVVVSRAPTAWGAKEIHLAERLLERADELDPAQAMNLARRLVRRLEIQAPELLEGASREDPVLALRQALETRQSPPR
ncbi:MAG: RDD family protein [Acidobacteriota bacterium]